MRATENERQMTAKINTTPRTGELVTNLKVARAFC